MWGAGDGSLLFTGDNNSSARYCSLNDNGSIAAVGYDDCTLKVRLENLVSFCLPSFLNT